MASEIIFLKRATDGKRIITGRSRMGDWFELFDHRQRDYLNLKKDGQKETTRTKLH